MRRLILLVLLLTATNTAFSPNYLVIWRGEGDASYVPIELRHQELTSALSLEQTPRDNAPTFSDALPATDLLQYVSFDGTPTQFSNAVTRCATTRSAYMVLGSGDSFSTAASSSSSSLHSSFTPDELSSGSWSLRARDYRGRKFGKQLASPLKSGVERAAIIDAVNFTNSLHGPVKLQDPDLALFSFILPPFPSQHNDASYNPSDARENPRYLLLRQFCFGFNNLRRFDPNTRKCVTSTPLEPIAAFSMANVGMVNNQSTILDPYCGSATTLLASAALAPECKTVGIERDGNWMVNFTEVESDFSSRNLLPPTLLRGDCRNPLIRRRARASAPNGFDVILADPPYGKRERKDDDSEPLADIMNMIIEDKTAGTPILKSTGRLVVFVPFPTEETRVSGEEILENLRVTKGVMSAAGLKLVEPISAQRLNKSISRLLLVFEPSSPMINKIDT